MKRITIWIIILLLGLVAVSNERSIEISDRALVHAVGIDQDDSGYTVTLQVFKSEGAGSDTQIDPSKPNTRIISNTAKTVSDAMTLCENQLGNYLFIGHNQVIVLGSGVDLNNPKPMLDYFLDNKDSFLGVDMVLAEEKAKDILDVQVSTGTITTENFKEVLKMYRDKGEVLPSSMVDFFNGSMKPDKSMTLPIVSAINSKGEPEQKNKQDNENQDRKEEKDSEQDKSDIIFSVSENAVFSDGALIGTLSPDETRCVNLLTNKTKYTTLTIPYKEQDIGLLVKKRSSKAKIKVDNNRLIYDVKLKVTVTPDNSTFSKSEKAEISHLVEKQLTEQGNQIFEKIYREYNADIFNINSLAKHYVPKVYLKYKDNFDALKSNIGLNISVDCITK